MFPTMAAEKLAVADVTVVLTAVTASVVEILTVALWQEVHEVAFLLLNCDMSVPLAPVTKPPPLVSEPAVRISKTVEPESAAKHWHVKRQAIMESFFMLVSRDIQYELHPSQRARACQVVTDIGVSRQRGCPSRQSRIGIMHRAR